MILQDQAPAWKGGTPWLAAGYSCPDQQGLLDVCRWMTVLEEEKGLLGLYLARS